MSDAGYRNVKHGKERNARERRCGGSSSFTYHTHTLPTLSLSILSSSPPRPVLDSILAARAGFAESPSSH